MLGWPASTVLLAGTAWIFRNATSLRRVSLMPRRIEIACPLPDISDHVQYSVAVRRKSVDRRRSRKPIGTEILVRKLALPSVGEILAARHEFITPREFGVP